MAQEQKDILLKDLCSRLPYKVKAQIPDEYGGYTSTIESIDIDGFVVDFEGVQIEIEYIKPYLFPLSSMTEEQESYLYFNTKFRIDMFGDLVVRVAEDDNYCYTDIIDYASLINWLNKNHFDYQGLIEKGLAIDATGLNIY